MKLIKQKIILDTLILLTTIGNITANTSLHAIMRQNNTSKMRYVKIIIDITLWHLIQYIKKSKSETYHILKITFKIV